MLNRNWFNLLSKIPLIPIPVKELAAVEKTRPSELYYNQPQLPALGLQELPVSERPQILKSLVRRAIDSLQRIEAMVAEDGSEERAKGLLQRGKWSEARKRLEALQPDQRTAEDWYNLGLSYEGGALSRDDYEEARRVY